MAEKMQDPDEIQEKRDLLAIIAGNNLFYTCFNLKFSSAN